MPIIGGAMVMPELIPVTYAKVRAELQRELLQGELGRVEMLILSASRDRFLLERGSVLPTVEAAGERALWRLAIEHAAQIGVPAEIAGWAGERRAELSKVAALTLIARESARDHADWADLSTLPQCSPEVRMTVERGLAQLAPTVNPAELRGREVGS
jgi:hypothetical protein